MDLGVSMWWYWLVCNWFPAPARFAGEDLAWDYGVALGLLVLISPVIFLGVVEVFIKLLTRSLYFVNISRITRTDGLQTWQNPD